MLATLLHLGYLQMRNWLRISTSAKLLVITGFILTILFTAAGEYLISSSFFQYAAYYPPFGQSIAIYCMLAAVLILFIFATISSFSMSYFNLYQNPQLLHWHTLPISPQIIFFSRLIPSFVSSFAIYLLLLPLLIAFHQHIHPSSYFVLQTILGILLLAIASQSLGTVLLMLSTYIFKRLPRINWVITLTITVLLILALVQVIFPPGFLKIRNIPDVENFQIYFNALPLMNPYIPTNWLANIFFLGDTINLTLGILFTTGLLIALYLCSELLYFKSWHQSQTHGHLRPSQLKLTQFPKTYRNSSPILTLLINECLGYVRSTTELYYTGFLGMLLLLILLLMGNIDHIDADSVKFLPAIYTLSFVGIINIFIILSMRLIYPRVAKEKPTAWFYFSLPISKEHLIASKGLFGLILLAPIIPIAIYAPIVLKLPTAAAIIFTTLIILTTLAIYLVQFLIGTISPNFTEATNPEAASTSGSGFAALTSSLFLTFVSAMLLYFYFQGLLLLGEIVLLFTGIIVVVALPLIRQAKKSLHQYNL